MLDSVAATALPTVRAPFARGLERLVADRDDVVVLTADLSKWTDVLEFARRHPDRFVQVGMAEQNLVGVAAGVAKTGLVPIVVTFGVFATRRAYDQIAMSMMTRPVDAVIAGFLPGLDSRFRGTHQAIDDVALMSSLPGMTVLDPADATELEAAVAAAVERPGVVYVRCSRGDVEQLFEPADGGFEIGAVRTLAASESGVATVSTGAATRWVHDVRNLMAPDVHEPPPFTHVHCGTLKPFPSERMAEICASHRVVVTVENHLIDGGLGSAVAASIADHGLGSRLIRLGIPDRWGCYGTPAYSRSELGLDRDSLHKRIAQVLEGVR